MAFVSVDNTAQVQLIFQQENQRVQNTLWVEAATAWGALALEDLCRNVRDWWIGGPRTSLSVAIALIAVRADDMEVQNGAYYELSVSTDNVGLVAGNALPLNCSFTIDFNTAFRGRSFRGRNKLVGLAESQTNGSGFDQSVADDFIGYYNDLKAGLLAEDWTHVVASRYSGINQETGKPIPRAAGVTTPVFSYSYYDLIIDSQRRRLPGRGQ